MLSIRRNSEPKSPSSTVRFSTALSTPVREQLSRSCPAKINLMLRVLGKRADGFHELETVMLPVNFCDQLSATLRADSQFKLRVLQDACSQATSAVPGTDGKQSPATSPQSTVEIVPTDQRNLIIRVAEGFRQRLLNDMDSSRLQSDSQYQITGVDFQLRKRIPAGAGLGGASSNAATALKLLNELWNVHWPNEKLAEFSASYGSDIPFFFTRQAAYCQGRGERISAFPADCSKWMVVVRPSFGLSTPEVFRELNAAAVDDSAGTSWERDSVNPDSILSQIRHGQWIRVSQALVNDLVEPARRLRPELGELEKKIRRTQPLGMTMSGSGSCYFAVYPSRRTATIAAQHLRNQNVGRAFVVRPTVAP